MDRPLLRRFPYTAIALALAFTVGVLSAIFDVSRFDLPGADVLRMVARGFHNETASVDKQRCGNSV
jgi:hypothetical protein